MQSNIVILQMHPSLSQHPILNQIALSERGLSAHNPNSVNDTQHHFPLVAEPGQQNHESVANTTQTIKQVKSLAVDKSSHSLEVKIQDDAETVGTEHPSISARRFLSVFIVSVMIGLVTGVFMERGAL
eukprot:751908-Rhodomonas_salina.4